MFFLKNNIQIVIINVNLLKHMVDDYSKVIQQETVHYIIVSLKNIQYYHLFKSHMHSHIRLSLLVHHFEEKH